MSFIGARCYLCDAAAPVLYTHPGKYCRLLLCGVCFEREAQRPCPGPSADNAVRTTHAAANHDCDEFMDVTARNPGDGLALTAEEWVRAEKKRRAGDRARLRFWSNDLATAFRAGACPRLVLRQQRCVPHSVVSQLTLAEVVAAFVPVSQLILDARFEGLPACTSLTCRGPIAAALRHRLFPAHLLKHLGLTECTELTDTFLAALPALCPRLETMTTLHCPMTSSALRRLAACEKLRVIRIHDTAVAKSFCAELVFGVSWPALEVFDTSRLPLPICSQTERQFVAPCLTTLLLGGRDDPTVCPTTLFDLPSLTALDAPLPPSMHGNKALAFHGVPRFVQRWAGLPTEPAPANQWTTPLGDMFGFYAPAPAAIRQLTFDVDVSDQFPLLVEAETSGDLPRSFARGSAVEEQFASFDLSGVSADVMKRREAEVEALTVLLDQTQTSTEARFWPWPKLTRLTTVIFPPLPVVVLSQLTELKANLFAEDLAVVLQHCRALRALRTTATDTGAAVTVLGPDRALVVARALLLALPRALACLVALRRRSAAAKSRPTTNAWRTIVAPAPPLAISSLGRAPDRRDNNAVRDGFAKVGTNTVGVNAMVVDTTFLSNIDVAGICGRWFADFHTTIAPNAVQLTTADRFEGPLFPGAPGTDPADYATFCHLCADEAERVVAAAPSSDVRDVLVAALFRSRKPTVSAPTTPAHRDNTITANTNNNNNDNGSTNAAELFAAEVWPPECDDVESHLDCLPELRTFGFTARDCASLPSLLSLTSVAHGGGHVELAGSSSAAAPEVQLWAVVAAVWSLLDPLVRDRPAVLRGERAGASGGDRRRMPPRASSASIAHVGAVRGREEAAALLEALIGQS